MSWESIEFKGNDVEGVTTCPICSPNRRKKYQRCLSYNRETGVATCHHCGTTIRREDGTIYTPKPIVEYKPKPIKYSKVYGKMASRENGLFRTIADVYGDERTLSAFKRYKTSIDGNNVYYHQHDGKGIRYVKRVAYGDDGKRLKDGFNIDTPTLSKDGFTQCLFGLHLYKDREPIRIVESEKTAIICSIKMPDVIWMATGGKNNMKHILDLPNVILCPDLDAVDDWSSYEVYPNVKVDRQIVVLAEEMGLTGGVDLADILLNIDG